ncbi:MAG: HAMP domain-containing histidine kinase [Oscillospiraceae bacterium]|jgi:signal transduction histidine kinase|nr:HAMP domain-containing histidine kinase [Oscillospiraceae bacterium]
MKNNRRLSLPGTLVLAGLGVVMPAAASITGAVLFPDKALVLLLAGFGIILAIALMFLYVLYNNTVVPLQGAAAQIADFVESSTGKSVLPTGADTETIAKGVQALRLYLSETQEERALYEENRKDIIAGISHDMGTPLTAIIGYASGLLDGIVKTPEQQRSYLETIVRTAQDLNQLTNDFFLFSCLDRTQFPMHFEEMRYEDIFAPIRFDLTEKFQENNIQLQVVQRGFPKDEKVYLSVDPVQMGRIFQNLSNNCIKYIQRSDQIAPAASLSAEYLPDKRLRFTLESNGIAVSREDCGRIFTPYFRVGSAKTNTVNGSGIGLTVCKQLVDKHGGTICARPSTLGGLAIEVTFSVIEPLTLVTLVQ